MNVNILQFVLTIKLINQSQMILVLANIALRITGSLPTAIALSRIITALFTILFAAQRHHWAPYLYINIVYGALLLHDKVVNYLRYFLLLRID